jgi:hypothetical protein
MSYAVVSGNVVVNVIAWDGVTTLATQPGQTMIPMASLPVGAGLGWTLVGSAWEPPQVVPVVPDTVALWQAKAALSAAGLLTQADAAIAAANNSVLTLFWATAANLDRASPTLATLAGALNLSSAQVDQLFIQAAGVSL